MATDVVAPTAMVLDENAQRGLHLVDEERRLSLLTFLGKTKTTMGKKMLREWLLHPLLDVRAINQRLDVVQTFYDDSPTRILLRDEVLQKIPDIPRVIKQIGTALTLELVVDLYDALTHTTELTRILRQFPQPPDTLQTTLTAPIEACMEDFAQYRELVETVVDVEAARDGEYKVREEFDENLHKFAEKRRSIQQLMQNAVQQAATDLNVPVAKIRLVDMKDHGKVLRVAKSVERFVKEVKTFTIIQSTKGECKFTFAELQKLNVGLANVDQVIASVSEQFVAELAAVVPSYFPSFEHLAELIAQVDVLQAFATVAIMSIQQYVRPTLRPASDGIIRLKAARHALAETIETSFIENDALLDRKTARFQIVTGPNMGGKSTYLRTIGLCVVLAQIGMFVPCSEAEVSLCDAVLCRIGAGDDIVRGVSTFMAEMLDSAAIIKRASENTLVLIDELGRGTSTFDGFGIAWAISEFLAVDVGCYCVFATHFHELTALEQRVSGVVNKHVVADVVGQSLVLQYKVEHGSTDQSLAIHVAEWADFPQEVVNEAKRKASELNLETPAKKRRIESFAQKVPLSTDVWPQLDPKEVDDGKMIVEQFEKDFTAASGDAVDALVTKYAQVAQNHPMLKLLGSFA